MGGNFFKDFGHLSLISLHFTVCQISVTPIQIPTDDTISIFIQVNVCFKTVRTSLGSVSQKIAHLLHVVLVFVTMEIPFVKRLYPVRLHCPVHATFTLQMTSVVQFSNVSIVVSKDVKFLANTLVRDPELQ